MLVIFDIKFTDTLVSLISDSYLSKAENGAYVHNYWHFLQSVSNEVSVKLIFLVVHV